jgi:hypothetical protein
MIKMHLTREAAEQMAEGLRELKKEEEGFLKRWSELEAKRQADLAKREAEYKTRREQINKFEKEKAAKEIDDC